MMAGTIRRMRGVALRQELASGLASPDCCPPDGTRSCTALRCKNSVTYGYQSDSSSKRPAIIRRLRLPGSPKTKRQGLGFSRDVNCHLTRVVPYQATRIGRYAAGHLHGPVGVSWVVMRTLVRHESLPMRNFSTMSVLGLQRGDCHIRWLRRRRGMRMGAMTRLLVADIVHTNTVTIGAVFAERPLTKAAHTLKIGRAVSVFSARASRALTWAPREP